MASKAKAPRVFVPLTKVDEEQRLVYGTITQEVLDKSGEVMDYDLSKPHFQKWSDDIHTASGGLSKGNLRVMHGLSVAGKLTEIEFDDVAKSVEVCAKVVDDAEWNKVLEGCYTGFSVGGSYGKKWTETVGEDKIKKFEAKPNEVSLVDNPCVPTATFSLVKADGAEEAVTFKVENDDEQWPAFSKADAVSAEQKPEAEEETPEEKPLEKAEPTNEEVVAKAEELAKAAADGTTWMNHVELARTELMKAESKPAEEIAPAAEEEKPEEIKKNEAEPAPVRMFWKTTDDKIFDKVEDAKAHQETLGKAEPTEAEKLKARLEKATTEETEEAPADLMSDYDRLGKVFQALGTPFDTEAGAPKLEKGMYTVSRFANVLWDLGALARKIAKEGVNEGGAEGDPSDKAVSTAIKTALATLGESLKEYLDNQLTELVSGIDDEVCVAVYDYYYAAAKDDSEDQLAKDVCSVIDERREPSRERREELAKSFGFVSGTLEALEEELSPPMQKRFDALEAENVELKKVAGEAVEKVEQLAKRMKTLEDTTQPRALTGHVHLKEGDFFGKQAATESDKLNVLKSMLDEHGPDGMATLMIKASQASGGTPLR